MAKSNSSLENTKIDAMELFILNTLLRGENVIIPDFGHLELKTFGDRQTVIFKSTNKDDSFLRIVPAAEEQEKRDINAIYTTISVPLKEGKDVSLPQIGLFHPKKRENGETYIDFTPSSSLRRLLNNKGSKEIEEVKKETTEIKDETKEVINNIQKDKGEISNEGTVIKVSETKINSGKSEIKGTLPPKTSDIASKFRSKPSLTQKTQLNQTVDTRYDSKKSKSRNFSGLLLVVLVILAVIFILVTVIHSRHKDEQERAELIIPATVSESISLTRLAEQHYGNPAFWIYIYETNKDKLKSPINIPKNVSLIIPDLKSEYDVDITDSMEIQRANILADIVLKKEKIITNK